MASAADLSPPSDSRQAVLVVAADWSSSNATLQRYTRTTAEKPWMKAGAPANGQIGERGLAWGRGLHRVPEDKTPRKIEGDRRAPAGIFRITGAFGWARAVGKMPWQTITPTLEAVDDPQSRFYNRLVDRAKIAQPDWHSSEKMARIPDYALGLNVEHNPQNIRGAGSCIFIHLWNGARRGSAGCTLLREADLVELLHWLDPEQQPILIQLPRSVADRELKGF